MSLDQLIQQCWKDHADDTVAVAARLEVAIELVHDAPQAAQYSNIVNHVIGEHLNDWRHAAGLVSSVAAKLKDEPAAASTWAALCVAYSLAGELTEAVVAESRALAVAKAHPLATLTRVRMQLVTGLMGLKRLDEAARVYVAALEMADQIGDKSNADRSIAVTSNNLASELCEKENRNKEQTALMLKAAHAARSAWLRAGDWMNDERADYLLALTHNAAGQHGQALEFARRGLATIASNGKEDVDAAFLHLTSARAHGAMGHAREREEELTKADILAEGFDAGTRDWFNKERAKV